MFVKVWSCPPLLRCPSEASLVGSAWQECAMKQLCVHQLLFCFFLMQVCDQCGTMLVTNFSYLLEIIVNMKYLGNKMSTGCSQAAFNRQWTDLGVGQTSGK